MTRNGEPRGQTCKVLIGSQENLRLGMDLGLELGLG